jgi:hypothetical protein
MAINQLKPHRVNPNAFFNPQLFLAYGPPPEATSKRAALRRFLHRHLLWLLTGAVGFLFWLEELWAARGYPGLPMLLVWRFELLAAGLSMLAGLLAWAIWKWRKTPIARPAKPSKHAEEINMLLCTPPPLAASANVSFKPRAPFTIEYWASYEAVPWSEDNLQMAELPDEFLAPDTLVLNIRL